ncbi:hypothetical protein [Mangrovimonas sp. ST2L15]|uniref:hypothetical protein n=1 Tax=Mangrovimonas sp. ST2L15 TaxID=1645916 RepID=UPI0006B5CB5D|nr:hypothetical protein [Mangrovimonas sp. ST2L15]
MKPFIFKTGVFLFVSLLLLFGIFSKADGYSDSFYIKFTTPKQSSLILGTSRAAQGLQPKVFDSILKIKFSNYSFSVIHSPYGSTYLNSVKKKLDASSKQGIFIVTVDPWSLSSFTKVPDDSLSFREVKLALGNTPVVNIKPNPFYLLLNREGRYYDLIIDKQSNMFLHDNGWLEVNVELDSLTEIENVSKKVKKYREGMLQNAQFSQNRFKYLKETIKFLKENGEVYLVRLPVHPKMMELDDYLMPYFDKDIESAIDLSDGYLDITSLNTEFHYTDGNHLQKESGKVVSTIIANWIDEK